MSGDQPSAQAGPAGPAFSCTVLTLYPDMFPGPLGQSLAGTALQEGLWSLSAYDIRQHGQGRLR